MIDYVIAALLIRPLSKWLGKIVSPCPPDCEECNNYKGK